MDRPAPRALWLALLCCLLVGSPPLWAEEIKIEVVSGKPHAQVTGTALHATQGPEGRPLPLAGGPQHRLVAKGEALLLDGKVVREPLLVEAGGGQLSVEGKTLLGRIEVWAEKGALVLVNALDLEEYVAAVVSSEVPGGWPAAALQAQAVAARTYAVAQKVQLGAGARAHLGASVLDQVYKGAANPQARAASQATLGEVLTWESAPIAAWFSASCGGKSESAEAAFNTPAGSAPYAVSQDDGDADLGYRGLTWTVKRPLKALEALLRRHRKIGRELLGLTVAEQTASGRAKLLKLQLAGTASATISGVELRQLVGYTALPSLLFTVEREGSQVVFHGRGSGHGVGLCQWGARGRASRGEGYREILGHYYPGAEVRRMY